MSDTPDTTDTEPEEHGEHGLGRRGKTEREKARVEAVPKRLDFFEWLEKLFYDEPEVAQFPEKIEVNPVSGKLLERLSKPIMQKLWGAKDPKPTRPQLVALSNEILFRCQRDCDIQRKAMVYGVHASHLAREPDYYERWMLRFQPTISRADEGAPREDIEADSIEEKFAVQILRHQERMVELLGGGFEGQMDRMDRILERVQGRNERLEDRVDKLVDALERALNLEAERKERLEWTKIKVKGAEKALDMGLALAPPLLNRLVGKTVIPTTETPETIALKRFFQKKEEGGLLTPEQSNLVFGIYKEEPPHEMVHPGVLSIDQAKLLYDVAYCNVPPDELDKLLPGGPLAITIEQVEALQSKCGLTLDQLAPIHLLLEQRLNARKKDTK